LWNGCPARFPSTEAARSPRFSRARTHGSISGNGSGDIFIAFSTANPGAAAADHVVDLKMLPNEKIEPVFGCNRASHGRSRHQRHDCRRTMTGIENHKVIALPHPKLREVLKKYNRLAP